MVLGLNLLPTQAAGYIAERMALIELTFVQGSRHRGEQGHAANHQQDRQPNHQHGHYGPR
jgi:hypothetical protein